MHIADPRSAALVRRCVPVRSNSRGELPVMPSTALRCAVSEDRGGTRAAQGPVWGMHAPVAAPGAGLRAPPGAPVKSYDVYYPSHALPLQTNHQQRKPTRPPTTTTAATEMPAMAPLLSLGPLLLAVLSFTR